MNSTDSPRPTKLVDYTKRRDKNKVLKTTTKAFLSHEHHSCEKDIPSMITISASSMDATNADDDCAHESAEPNDFLLKVPPRTNRKQATSDLRERSNTFRRKPHERKSASSKRGDMAPEISTKKLNTTCGAPASVEPIDFFLKIPPPNQRRRSDLREIFQSSRSQSGRKVSILQSILSESSTTPLASRRLPSSSSNSDSFRI